MAGGTDACCGRQSDHRRLVGANSAGSHTSPEPGATTRLLRLPDQVGHPVEVMESPVLRVEGRLLVLLSGRKRQECIRWPLSKKKCQGVVLILKPMVLFQVLLAYMDIEFSRHRRWTRNMHSKLFHLTPSRSIITSIQSPIWIERGMLQLQSLQADWNI